MKIVKNAMVGSLESNDLLISVKTNDTLEVKLQSIVLNQYGDDIKKCINDVLKEYNIENGSFYIQDRGALECTIRARMETVVERGGEL